MIELIKKIILWIITILSPLFISCGDDTSTTTQPAEDPAPASYTFEILSINKYGNVQLATSKDELESYNIEIGDTVFITVGDGIYEIPFGTSFTDVDAGEMILRYDTEDDEIVLAVNHGNFADSAGIATKETTEEAPGYKWNMAIEEVTVSLKEKQGYLDEYNIRNLVRTNDRADYTALSDEDFANFREVAVSGIKAGVLYRSSSPVDPDIGRSAYAMAATENAGIKTIINLNDSVETMQNFDGYEDSYYSSCAVINPEMNYDFTSDATKEKVKDCIEFIISNDGPYLIHCKEGKDRTGFLCALLECYADTPLNEIQNDYMQTYINFYHLTKDDSAYNSVLKNSFGGMLKGVFGVDDLAAADLQAEAEEYLLSTGLTVADLQSLATIISE